MPQYTFSVKLYLCAPILSQATGGRKHGIDTVMLRNSADNLCLLGSSIRGNLRHAWKQFEKFGLDEKLINQWLGEESPKDKQNDPARAQLSFDYYWQAEQQPKPKTEQEPNISDQIVRHRIRVNRETGTVESGALQVIEAPYLVGEEVCFTGKIYALLSGESEKNILTCWLKKGFNYIPAIGAFRGVGFGRVARVEIHEVDPVKSNTAQKITAVPSHFGITLTLDRPFCFAKHHHGNNHFASTSYIPGAAIVGALAHRLPENPALRSDFDKLIVSHAFPAKKGKKQRSLAIPYGFVSAPTSLPKDSSKKIIYDIYDISLKKNAGLIHECAPAFSPDWKEEMRKKAHELCHQCDPSRAVHTHTAINSTAQRAKESQLFSMEVVEVEEHQWLANINCEKLSEAARTELWQLLHTGLYGLGKTKATATIICDSKPYAYPVTVNQLPEKTGETFVLMLQTAALLLPPVANPPQNLKDRYADTWKELFNDSVELSHFYAQQQLVGGGYLHERFWKKKEDCQNYQPEILTTAGSVFIFKVNDLDTVQTCLKKWLKTGLPQHSKTPGGENWQQNPYIAANGYGEIVINPQWQTAKLAGAWHELN